jgi:hypothetical protein
VTQHSLRYCGLTCNGWSLTGEALQWGVDTGAFGLFVFTLFAVIVALIAPFGRSKKRRKAVRQVAMNVAEITNTVGLPLVTSRYE